MTSETFAGWTLGLLAYKKRTLVSIDSSSSVSDALALLQRENLLAAPVWDSSQQSFIALLTLSELVSFVVFDCISQQETSSSTPSESSDQDNFRTITDSVSSWLSSKESKSPPLIIRPYSDSIVSILPLLSTGDTHHLLVRLEDGEYRIVSQTDVLRFLGAISPRWKHAAWSNQPTDKPFPDILSKTIDSAGLVCGAQNIVTVPISVNALEAFRILSTNNVRAAPVIDLDGVVLTTLSTSDLRAIRPSTLKSLKRPILDFLQQYRGDFHLSYTIQSTDKLQAALLQFMSVSIHRLWIINDANKLQGALSMTDLLRTFAEAFAQ